MEIVLGSASPRRAELLAQLGVAFRQRSADIDETRYDDEAPRDYVRRVARDKAMALRPSEGAALLLTADTTVIAGGRSLGKPVDRRDGFAMLSALSGAVHEVCTAVCVALPSGLADIVVSTRVEFAVLPDALIDAYLDTPEPWDKAGAYAIQGLGGSFVRRVDGSVSNVIGLPLVETRELLARFGIASGVGVPAA